MTVHNILPIDTVIHEKNDNNNNKYGLYTTYLSI